MVTRRSSILKNQCKACRRIWSNYSQNSNKQLLILRWRWSKCRKTRLLPMSWRKVSKAKKRLWSRQWMLPTKSRHSVSSIWPKLCRHSRPLKTRWKCWIRSSWICWRRWRSHRMWLGWWWKPCVWSCTPTRLKKSKTLRHSRWRWIGGLPLWNCWVILSFWTSFYSSRLKIVMNRSLPIWASI